MRLLPGLFSISNMFEKRCNCPPLCLLRGFWRELRCSCLLEKCPRGCGKLAKLPGSWPASEV